MTAQDCICRYCQPIRVWEAEDKYMEAACAVCGQGCYYPPGYLPGDVWAMFMTEEPAWESFKRLLVLGEELSCL
jgi:hypothetical protein